MKLTLIFFIIAVNSINLTAQVNEVWVAAYNGGYPSGIALDASGNIIVTGHFTTGAQGFGTIKYNSSGVQQWASSYSFVLGDNVAYSLAVDNAGNIYVTGKGTDGSNVTRILTVKYDAAGNQQWVEDSYSKMLYNQQMIGADAAGNVYIGSYSTGGGPVFQIIKYSPAGSVIWNLLGPLGLTEAISITPGGNMYATGYSVTTGGTQFTTIKYDSAGYFKWIKYYSSAGNFANVATAIALDANENVYVAGFSADGNGVADYATLKYDSAGNQQWVARYNGPADSADHPTSLAVDNSGNVYVTGYSPGIGSRNDYATVKYNSAGTQQWAARYNGPGNGDDQPHSLRIDNNSNVYVTGSSMGSGTGYDYATIKYNSSGVQQWIMRYDNSLNANDYGSSLVIDNSGNVYVTGEANNEYVTIKYSQVTGINTISSDIPRSYGLSQNYPNPFNPSTKIKFGVPKNGYVRVVIYDAIGREVSTLVNEQLNPGTYEADWNASNFPSGVYFYKLASWDFSETKKLVLIK